MRMWPANPSWSSPRIIESLGIDEVVTVPVSARRKAHVERAIGSLRRELLEHVIKRVLSSYLDDYYCVSYCPISLCR